MAFTKINIKRDRELLGFQTQKQYHLPKFIKILGAALIVFLLATGIGELLGRELQQHQSYSTFINFQTLFTTHNIPESLDILKKMKRQAPNSPETTILYAQACQYAATIMPYPGKWLQESLLQLRLLNRDNITSPEIHAQLLISEASVLLDLKRDTEALTTIRKLNNHLSQEQLLQANPAQVEGGTTYYNTYAYILATTTDPKLKDPKLALELIKKVVIEPGGNSPAYLDTLAEANFINNKITAAIQAQRLALAQCDYPSLWILTEHFQEFNK